MDSREAATDLNYSGRFYFSCVLVSAVYLLTRLPYFIHYPVITVSSDSASYIAAAFSILEGSLPMFDIRTPGYPLFISAIWMFGKSFISVSLVQSLITYISSIFLLTVAYKYYARHVVLFAAAVCGFISSSYFIVLEMSMLTEGIFTSIMLLTAGVLMLAVKSKSAAAWAAVSFLFAVLIYVRPAGLFLAGLFFFMLIYFRRAEMHASVYAAAVVPFAFLILLLCTYNLFTLGKFTITPFGEANLAGATVLYMEPSDEYPEYLNVAIISTLDSIPRRDRNYVRNSYNPHRLFSIFKDHFHMQMTLVNNLRITDPGMTYLKAQPMLRQVSLDAIRKNPDVYAKFFYCNLYYFFTNIYRSMDYFEELAKIYRRSAIDMRFVKELEDGKWRQVSGNKELNERVKNFYVENFERQKSMSGFVADNENSVVLKDSMLKSAADAYQKLTDLIFRNILWLLLFAVMIFYAVNVLHKSRFRDEDAVLAMMLTLMFIFKALLVGSVESSLERYSYTVEFAVYFSLPFTFILREKLKKLKSNTVTI